MKITSHRCHDIRFPTSDEKHGSDAMNQDPDYSCAYVELLTDFELSGHGLTFTIGRGTELCTAAIDLIAPALYGVSVDEFTQDPGQLYRRLTADSQIRWLGPEKGVVQLATGAIINAVWDLLAKRAKLPLWRYVGSLPPERIVQAIDFRHISDYLSPEEALARLTEQVSGRNSRIKILTKTGYPAYTTSAGWLGYNDNEVIQKLNDAYEKGWRRFKLKVGQNLNDDIRRCRIFRDTLGPDVILAIDANQIWDVDEAVSWIKRLEPFQIHWIEEPTSPDDILAHRTIAERVHPIGVATGEHAHNRVMFKQFLQSGAISFCQLDACRLAGVNEALAVMLMADKAGVPVCPHAGGVGLCEYVQHLSMIDYIAVSGSMEGRMTEYSDHLHEHFVDPVRMKDGRYLAPYFPGFSVEMRPESREDYAFPDGKVWAAQRD